MNKQRRGFTLIELLAVIVILAIIALIAVPVIMNIISDARKKAFENTAYGLISAGEMYYAGELLNGGIKEDVEFIISNGEFEGTNKLEVNGALPTNGKVKVTTDGKVALAITNGAICIKKGYDASKIETLEEFESCELPTATQANTLTTLAVASEYTGNAIASCLTDGSECAPGTLFAIEVAPDVVEIFYVVSDKNNKVTLITSGNIDNETVAWNASGVNAEGPLTAIAFIEEKTNSWVNIPEFNYTYADENDPKVYQDILKTNIKARLLTRAEALDLGCSLDGSYTCPSWLSSNHWISAVDVELSGQAIYDAKYLDGYLGGSADASYLGVRPVIELSK